MGARASRPAEDSSAREIFITRVFDAPRKLVFEAWSELRHVAQWWGPRGFSCTFEKFELRQGGEWIFVMHGPDGRDYPNWLVFTEVVKPERLVYSHGGGEEDHTTDFQSTVTFEAQGNRTKVTMRALFPSAAERDRVVEEYGAIEGGQQTLERLGEHLGRMARR